MPAPVLIDARAAARPELGGVERWAREVAARLPRLDPGRYRVVAPRPRLVHRAGHAWEQVALPAIARRAGADVVLGPANLAPLAWPRNVLVLHDAAAFRHPEWYSPLYAAWQRTLVPALVRRASAVVTVSQFSRRELAELFGIDAAVVPGGVDPSFSPGADAEVAARGLGLERPYVLTVASRTSRKNLAALRVAAGALAREGVELVAAGGHRPQFSAEGEVSGIRSLGRVSEALLPGLYAGAEAFVLPSRYEGFGLPCLEAMAAGVPVVAAASSALPEVCGDAAILADPEDPAALAAAILQAREERGRLVPGGLRRAGLFRWEETARRLDAVVGSVLSDPRA